MRLETIGSIVVVALFIGTGLYMSHHPQAPAETEAAAPAADETIFTKFCRRAQLVRQAETDCENQMKAAADDAERMRIERTFAMGSVKVDSVTAAP